MKYILSLSLFLVWFIVGGYAQTSPANGQWTVVASYETPGGVLGLTNDGAGFCVFCFSSGIQRFNPLDSTFIFAGGVPIYYTPGVHELPPETNGLTFRPPHLVSTQMNIPYGYRSVAMGYNPGGTYSGITPCPNVYTSAICWDTDHFWGSIRGGHQLEKFDQGGNLLATIHVSEPGVLNLYAQGDTFWVAGDNNMLVKINDTGAVAEQHPCLLGQPAAIYFDGTFIWYAVNYGSQYMKAGKIMKVDPNGSGTPLLSIDTALHDYGVALLNDSLHWDLKLKSTGQGPLIINRITFSQGAPFTSGATFPLSIPSGDSAVVRFTFSTSQSGRFSARAVINSNDPLFTNQVVELKGTGVYSGPHLSVALPQHDFGSRRLRSTAGWKLQLVNDGSQTLAIDSFAANDSAFYTDPFTHAPLAMATLDTTDLWIWFRPRKAMAYSATLAIHSNAAAQDPYILSLHGTGLDSVYAAGSTMWHFNFPQGRNPVQDEYAVALLQSGDLNGDSIGEVVVNTYGGHTYCLNGSASGEPEVLWSNYDFFIACRDQDGIKTIPDIDGDGAADIIIAGRSADTLFAWSGRTGAVIWKHGFYKMELEQIDVNYDYNGDGFPDVLLALGSATYYSCAQPKNVYCLNGKDGSTLWRASTSHCAYSVKGIEDITGDGKPDAIAGTSTHDTYPSAVYALDGTSGNTVWNHEASSRPLSFLQIKDVTGDSIRDLVAAEDGVDAWGGTTSLTRIDAANGNAMCSIWNGPIRYALKLEDMGPVGPEGATGILFSGGFWVNRTDIPGCSRPWWYHPWVASLAGDLNGDSIPDVFFASHNSQGTQDTVGYLSGKNGEPLWISQVENHVRTACTFPDLIGKGSPGVIAGGTFFVQCFQGAEIGTQGIAGPRGGLPLLHITPNPVDDLAHVEITLRSESHARLEAYDLYGRIVSTLFDGTLQAGTRDVIWNIDGRLNKGIYFLRLQTRGGSVVAKCMVGP